MTSQKNHDLAVRTLINGLSAIVIALFIFLAEIHPLRWIFVAAVSAIAAIAIWEYGGLVKKKGLEPALALSIVATVVYIFAVFFKTQGSFFWANAPEIVLGLAFFACFVHFAISGKPPIPNIATTFFGIIYIGVPLGLLVRIIYFFTFKGADDPYLQGSWWVIYLIAVTKSADIGGYFIGRRFGRRKLALKLSPNKTLEGALGGLVASILMSFFVCFLAKKIGHTFESFSYWQSFFLGLVIGILGQIGDLAESFLKRDAKVKDSNTIPGVGGILDMLDSLLFTAPVVYIFLKAIYIK
jgi:phosphatidate cytidylyltransferase